MISTIEIVLSWIMILLQHDTIGNVVAAKCNVISESLVSSMFFEDAMF